MMDSERDKKLRQHGKRQYEGLMAEIASRKATGKGALSEKYAAKTEFLEFIAAGVKDMAEGRYEDVETIFARLHGRYRGRREQTV